MPHFNLRYFLETLGARRGSDVSALQIGAMDGKTFDPIHEYVTRYKWGGVFVEPVAEHFAALTQNYRDYERIRCVNAAIAEHDGSLSLHHILPEHVENGDVPKWGYGLASVYKDRNALAFDEVKPFIVQEEVPCLTLSSLIAGQNIQHIDLLQIDAEGYDYHILKQLDFTRYKPLVINLEIVNLPKSEQTACKKILDEHGYIYTKAGYDLLAVQMEFCNTQ